jgi:hypothetical protein
MDAFALHNSQAMRVNDQMIYLGRITIDFKANSVQNQNVWVVTKEPLEVKGHLFFSSTASLRKLVVGLKWIKLFVDHVAALSTGNILILSPCTMIEGPNNKYEQD